MQTILFTLDWSRKSPHVKQVSMIFSRSDIKSQPIWIELGLAYYAELGKRKMEELRDVVELRK